MRSCEWLAVLAFLVPTSFIFAGDWPQFRGPNAVGLAEGAKLPDKIGPDQNVVWKVELPPGHSSPAVVGDRIYVTAFGDKKLLTIALDRETGRKLWQHEAPYQSLEKIHTIGSYAQPSPAADADVVVTFFGSSGLYCHNRDGKLLWSKPYGPFPNDFGAGSSPLIVGDRVILNQDHDNGSFLLVLDKLTGKQIWKVDRSEFPRGYATPVVWSVNGKRQIVVAGTLRAIGYDFDTGKEIWTLRRLARICNMTPVIGPDNTLYLATWAPGADENDRIVTEPWEDMLAKFDKNKNGMLELDEMPPGELKNRFTQIDRDKDGHISKQEYENMCRIFAEAQNSIVAVKPGGTGDITASHVLWTQKKYLPYIPSPLYYEGHLYMIKNGGLLSCLDPKDGKLLKQERVFGSANYYASPVSGDGKIYLFSEKGDASVVRAGADWEQLSRAKFGETMYASPAIVNGRIYVRTEAHLYCFGLKSLAGD
jgi:outer membrane protein assembly factor BamB